MFEQTFVEDTRGTKKPLSILASLTLQLCIFCILIGIPLLYTQGLPGRVLKSLLVAPPVPHAAIPNMPESKRQSKFAPRLLNIRQLLSRPVISAKADLTSRPAAAPDFGVNGLSTANGGNDLVAGVLGTESPTTVPPPALPKTKTVVPTNRITVGGVMAEARLIHKVTPPYPSMAKAARVQGVVEFTALISKDGNIENLQLVRGHPLLVGAAREAVVQWRYRPTLLNGAPVEVVTDIIVNFTLSQ